MRKASIYPYNLLKEEIFPLFGPEISELPVYIDISIDNEYVERICSSQTQKEFNDYMISEMQKHNCHTAVSGYLEDRTTLLKKYPQMVSENRVYHLGVDVTGPLGTDIYAPINGEVVESYYEEGEGNYGGMIVLKHDINKCVFYSLYGHLNRTILPAVGTKINKGEKFAKIGDFHENGNWFHHVHLQVFTELGYSNGWINKGYCSGKDLVHIDKFVPNPVFLLRL